MALIVYIAIYAGLLIFVIGCVRRIWQYASTPVHLRWELYPVPHEAPERVKHGGSYFETGDWWTKPQHSNHIGELRVMIPEILFMKGLWEFNRRLWLPSFLFHFGLYLLIGAIVLVGLGAGFPLLAPSLASERFLDRHRGRVSHHGVRGRDDLGRGRDSSVSAPRHRSGAEELHQTRRLLQSCLLYYRLRPAWPPVTSCARRKVRGWATWRAGCCASTARFP